MKQVRNVYTPTREPQQEDALDVIAGLLIVSIPAFFFYAVFASI